MNKQHFTFKAPSAEEYGLYRDEYLKVLYVPETEEYIDQLTDKDIKTVTIEPASRQKAEPLQFTCVYIDQVFKGHRQTINHGTLDNPKQLIIEAPDTMWRLHLQPATDDSKELTDNN